MPPAARMGDMTSHGGTIVGPCVPNVLIGSMPAAVVGDMTVCPMFNGPQPHVGGPIIPPCSVTVLIGGRPAARVGDLAQCPGPPANIVMGEFTVIIGG
ncbi:MAG TPA: PAAR domain-containing protein [Chthonomonadaceae bacterium]|nr:PAAR domain-containing protein [Chthonomonadaceae bacterium]